MLSNQIRNKQLILKLVNLSLINAYLGKLAFNATFQVLYKTVKKNLFKGLNKHVINYATNYNFYFYVVIVK